jgi:maltose/moltooligosaccharide transporter
MTVRHTPRQILAPLFAIQFLSWSGMFCLWIYAVPVITRFVLHAAPETAAYRTGLILISACFAFYALLGAGLSFVVPRLVERWGNGPVHGVALLAGGAGIATIGLADGPAGLAIAFPLIGVGWASMSAIPYAIVSAIAPEGRGAHLMRVFGFSTVIPQVIVTLGLAVIVPLWLGDAGYMVLVIGGAMMAAGGLLTLAWRTRFDLPIDPW